MREIEFSENLNVAGFPAVDFFRDGSFYLLDAPGVSRILLRIAESPSARHWSSLCARPNNIGLLHFHGC